MKVNLWPASVEEARKVQQDLKKKIEIRTLRDPLRFIAATDAAFTDKVIFAAATLYRLSGLVHEGDSLVKEELRFPYIPGLLAFREGHAITSAIGKLPMIPDVLLIEGHGIAHPEGIGIASRRYRIVRGDSHEVCFGLQDPRAPEDGRQTFKTDEAGLFRMGLGRR